MTDNDFVMVNKKELEKLERIRTSDVILIILILTLLTFLGIMYKKVDMDSLECLSNPVSYYQNLENVTCQCRLKTDFDYGGEFGNYQINYTP